MERRRKHWAMVRDFDHGASGERVTSPYPSQMYLSVHLFGGAICLGAQSDT